MSKASMIREGIADGLDNEAILLLVDTTSNSINWYRSKLKKEGGAPPKLNPKPGPQKKFMEEEYTSTKTFEVKKKPVLSEIPKLNPPKPETIKFLKEALKKEVMFIRSGVIIESSYAGEEMTPQKISNFIRYVKTVEPLKEDTVVLNELPISKAASIYDRLG